MVGIIDDDVILLRIVVVWRIWVRLDFVMAWTTALHVSIRLVKSKAHSLNACWVIDKCHVGVVGLRLLAYLQSVYDVWNRFRQHFTLSIWWLIHIGQHLLLLEHHWGSVRDRNVAVDSFFVFLILEFLTWRLVVWLVRIFSKHAWGRMAILKFVLQLFGILLLMILRRLLSQLIST